MDLSEPDLHARSLIYDSCMRRGQPPSVAELSSGMGVPVDEVKRALLNLANAHMLVLQDESSEILMASPFSAVPTSFLVETRTFSCYGNCIWDSFGIAAMLHQDVTIQTSCADCGYALRLQTTGNQVHGDPGLIHFAIPARRWWEDIVFT